MTALVPVPFRNTTLFLADLDGQPYTPMKPIVEGMGLDWKAQYRRLANDQKRWGMVMMTIPSFGGDQASCCLPLRKLPGWLMTIQPARVRPEIRDTVIAYQNECDDALWDYWSKGQAQNPRQPEPAKTLATDRYIELLEAENTILKQQLANRRRLPRPAAAIPAGPEQAQECHRSRPRLNHH